MAGCRRVGHAAGARGDGVAAGAMSVVGVTVGVTEGDDMTTATAERTTTRTAEDIDRDGLEVYCPEARGATRTRHYFCECCGATDHDLL